MKVAICTLYGNVNFGNKLQNYALQETLMKLGIEQVITFKSDDRRIITKIKEITKMLNKKNRKFIKFNKNINYAKKIIDYNNPKIEEKIDAIIYGSDQIWNTQFEGKYRFFIGDLDIPIKKIAYAASFGTNSIDEEYVDKYKKSLGEFYKISVREIQGKKIIKNMINKDTEVVLDPTLLLSREEWQKIEKKIPIKLPKRYVLNCFLGESTNEKLDFISKCAKENDCEIINILDKNDKYYSETGPSEFLSLIDNSYAIFTDSFHATVFSIIFEKPFLSFQRTQKNLKSMNSRIDTLLHKFKLQNNIYNSNKDNRRFMNIDYDNVKKILNKEKNKSLAYLKKSISK